MDYSIEKAEQLKKQMQIGAKKACDAMAGFSVQLEECAESSDQLVQAMKDACDRLEKSKRKFTQVH